MDGSAFCADKIIQNQDRPSVWIGALKFSSLAGSMRTSSSIFMLLAAGLVLAACASPEGPLDTLGTGNRSQAILQQSVQGSVPPPAGVSAQSLPAPGSVSPAGRSLPQTQFPQGPLAQASRDPLLADLSIPGQASRAPDLTLQDFSRIDPRTVPGSDPFADQRASSLSTTGPNSQQSLEQAVQSGLQVPSAAPILAPAQPVFPRVALAPISTAPEPQATQLFDALDDASFDGGMQLAFFGDDTARFIIRSQVSAIPAQASTSLLYAFDVYDARGTLRHRVSGARAIARTGPDGWAYVDQALLTQVGQEVARQLLAWFQQNPS